tara:strand:+ start:97 stop:798 length:702 start_codon:yes stop_codon:yes gene_type:complete
MKRVIAALLTAFVMGTSQADAGMINLVTNGSFEAGPLDSDPRWNAAQWITFGLNLGGFNDIDGWTVDPTGQIDLLRAGSFYGDASDGVRHIDLTGGPIRGKISQTISTVIGKTYQVNFDLLGISGMTLGGPVGVRSQIGDGGMFADFAPNPNETDWETQQWTFTATDTSSTLWFISQFANQFGNGPHIDNVRVVEAPVTAVPEPSSLVLCGIGTMGIILVLRRSRRKTASSST